MELTITFLNKNLETSGDYTSAKTFDFSVPSVLTMNLNETLDSLNGRIVHLPELIDIEIKDICLIHDNDNMIEDLYMVVSDYTITEEGLDNGTYTYDLTLCSETKDLEGVILPNWSVTPFREDPKTILDVLHELNNEYGEKIRKSTGFVNKWHISTRLMSRFQNIICPEKQWTSPTFREVLNDLLMVEGCIAKLQNGEIDYIDLAHPIGTQITNWNYIQRSNSLTSYASSLQMNMQNALQTKLSNIRNTAITVECIPLTSDNYLMTSDNLILKTKYPILNIKSLKMVGYTQKKDYLTLDSPDPQCVVQDFCNFEGYSLVKEVKEYQTLDIKLNRTGEQVTGAYMSKYQNYCVYFNRGGNVIQGFTKLTKKGVVLDATTNTLSIWWNRILSKVCETMPIDPEDPEAGHLELMPFSYYTPIFIIEYETTSNQVYRTSKDEVKNHHIVQDNQSSAWVDAYATGRLEKQKIDRLGNEVLLLNQRITTGTPAKVGDYWLDEDGNKCYAYQVQYQIFKDHLDVNAFLTKDYVLQDYFTSINSKIRTWVNAKEEAFEKQDIDITYAEFSKDKHNETETPNISPLILASPLKSDYNEIKPLYMASVKPSTSNHYFATDLISRIIGNSLVFTCGLLDNSSNGKYLPSDEDNVLIKEGTSEGTVEQIIRLSDELGDGATGQMQKESLYTDSNFEVGSFVVRLLNAFDVGQYHHEFITRYEVEPEHVRNLYESVFNTPYIDNSRDKANGIVSQTFNKHKDNKAVPSFTIQYEYCSDTRDIYFTEEWLKLQQLVRTGTYQASNLTVQKFAYIKGQQVLTDGETTDFTISAALDGNTVKITLSSDDLVEFASGEGLAICSGDNILIGAKVNTTSTAIELSNYEFYLNVIRDRNKSIYSSTHVKVGEI